jgi:hypothetical protein
MVGRGHTKENVGLLNDHDIPSKKVFKCVELTFNNPTGSLV